MRGVLTLASRLQPGDVILDEDPRLVERTMGVQGRKPKNGAPLMRIVFQNGDVVTVREDAAVRVRPRREIEAALGW